MRHSSCECRSCCVHTSYTVHVADAHEASRLTVHFVDRQKWMLHFAFWECSVSSVSNSKFASFHFQWHRGESWTIIGSWTVGHLLIRMGNWCCQFHPSKGFCRGEKLPQRGSTDCLKESLRSSQSKAEKKTVTAEVGTISYMNDLKVLEANIFWTSVLHESWLLGTHTVPRLRTIL